MARGIRFIAPIESMSGNLSGLQKLLYPTNDNSAYDSPDGQVNYARNYKPRYVGTYRRKDGLAGFQVKTRSAVNMTPATKMAMALLGGVGALTAAILRVASYKTIAETQMAIENEQGYGWKSLREFLDAKIRPALSTKADRFVITPVSGIFGNPWIATGNTGVIDLTIPSNTLVKFWSELSNGISYTVVNKQGISPSVLGGSAAAFNPTYFNSPYNTLRLGRVEVSGDGYVAINAPATPTAGTVVQILTLNGTRVDSGENITANAVYELEQVIL